MTSDAAPSPPTPTSTPPSEPTTPAPVPQGGSDAAPRRLHPATLLFRIWRILRQFGLPVLVALFAGGGRDDAFTAAAGALILFGAVGSWLRFSYTFDGRTFTVDEGIFNRKHRTVPVDRIQQVDMEAKLLHRLLGVVALRIDTGAGSMGAELNLTVVSRQEAERLRRVLLGTAHREGSPDAPAPEQRDRPIVQLSPGMLALGGVTGPEQLVMLGIVFWTWQLSDDLPTDWLGSVDPSRLLPRGPAAAVAEAVVLAVLWCALAAVAAVVKYYGFTLVCRDEAVHLRRGLFEQGEVSLALRRVQAVQIERSLIRRLFGLVSLRIRSGGFDAGFSSAVGRLVVPVLPADDVDRVLAGVLPAWSPLPPLEPAPRAAWRRSMIRWVVPSLVLPVVPAVLWWPVGALALAVIPVAALLGHLAYRGLAHGASDMVVVARSGALVRETAIAEKGKVQYCSLRSTPMQRRAGLATLRVHLAGGVDATVQDGDARRVDELYAQLTTNQRIAQDELRVRRALAAAAAED